MNLSLIHAVAALEQFENELVEAATTPTVQEDEASDNVGSEITQESEAIDSDADMISDRTDKLGGVIEMVESTDTPEGEPLPAVAQKGVDIALESLGLGLEADDTAKESKEGLLAKLRRFFVGLLEAMRRFAARIVDFVKRVYTYATDRSARNKVRAEKAKKAMQDKAFNRSMKDVKGRKTEKAAADVYSPRLLKAIRRVQGVSISAALGNVTDYVRNQGRIGQRDVVLDACVILGEVAEDPKNAEKKAADFVQLLERIGDAGTDSTASEAQRKAAGVSEDGLKVLVSAPFFAGHRAWIGVPKSINVINHYSHGVAELDKIGDEYRTGQTIPEVDQLLALADQVTKLDEAIVEYRKQGEGLGKVEDKLKMFADRVKSKVKEDAFSGTDVSSTRIRALANNMNTALPRLIKGPQVEAVKYASEVGSMVMSFVEASMAAYEEAAGVKSGSMKDIVASSNRGLPNMAGVHA